MTKQLLHIFEVAQLLAQVAQPTRMTLQPDNPPIVEKPPKPQSTPKRLPHIAHET